MDFTSLFPGLDTLHFLVLLNEALGTAQSAMFYYSETVVSGVRTFAKYTIIIFMMLYGWGLMSGTIKEPIQETWNRLFKLFAVVSVALSITAYKEVAEFIWDLPTYLTTTFVPNSIVDFLSNFIPGDESQDMAIMLVSVFMSAVLSLMTKGFVASNVGGDTDPTVWASAMGIGVAGASLSAIVAGIILIAKFSLSVLIALGPFFIMSLLFEKTKQYFDSWLSQVFNFIMVILLMTITVYILMPVLLITVGSYYLMTTPLGGGNGVLTLQENVELMTLIVIYIAIIKQVPTTAAALMRGYAIGAPQERSFSGGGASKGGGSAADTNAQAQFNNANANAGRPR